MNEERPLDGLDLLGGSRLMRKKSFWGWLSVAGLVGSAVAAGCSGSSAPVGQFSGAVGGEPCSSVGQTANASDGCNTCSCGTDAKGAAPKRRAVVAQARAPVEAGRRNDLQRRRHENGARRLQQLLL